MKQLTVRTLGGAEIAVGEMLLAPTSERAFALLFILAANRGRAVPRSTILATVFADAASDASHALRQMVYRMRQAGAPIETLPNNELRVDESAVEFDALDVIARGNLTTVEIASLRRGYLAGLPDWFSPAFADWMDSHRVAVSVRLRHLLLQAIADAKHANDWTAVEQAARACLSCDPLNEEATLALSESMVMVGSKAEAVAVLERYVAEIGPGARDLRLPAMVLKRRIAERVPGYAMSRSAVQLVGRHPELRRLLDLVAAVRAGGSRSLRIVGEPGIGKSRLIEELVRIAALDGATIVTVRVEPSDVRRPLSVFYDAVPRLMTMPGALGCAPESMEFLKRFSRVDESKVGTIDAEERESELLFANITFALRDLIAAVASEAPLLFVVEDAHWLDEQSASLIEEGLGESRPGAPKVTVPLGVILTQRPGKGVDRRRQLSSIEEMKLGPLDRASSAKLIDLYLRKPDAESTETKAWLTSAAAGSPLYAMLLVQHYETTRATNTVPPALSALIAAQLEKVKPAARKVLEMICVLGRYATIERTERLLQISKLDLVLALQELEELRLIRDDDSGIRVAHGLLEEHVRSRMQPVVRKLLHRTAAEGLEAEMAEDSSHVAWDSAWHWQEAGELDRAIEAMRQCAKQALALGQSREACEVLLHLSEQLASSEFQRGALEQLVIVADATSEGKFLMDGAAALLQRSSSQALTTDTARLLVLNLEPANFLMADAQSHAAELREIAGADWIQPAIRLRAAALVLARADATGFESDVEVAKAAGDQLCDTMVPPTFALRFRLILETAFGNLEAVPALVGRLLEEARAGSAALFATTLRNAAFATYRFGDTREANRLLVEAIALARAYRLRGPESSALSLQAQMAVDEGDIDFANHIHRQQALRDDFLPGGFWAQCEALLAQRRFTEALAVVDLAAHRFPALAYGKPLLTASAFRYRAQLGLGLPMNVAEVNASIVLFREVRRSFFMGSTIESVVLAADAVHGRALATQLAREYIVDRRSRLPLPAGLAAFAGEDESD